MATPLHDQHTIVGNTTTAVNGKGAHIEHGLQKVGEAVSEIYAKVRGRALTNCVVRGMRVVVSSDASTVEYHNMRQLLFYPSL